MHYSCTHVAPLGVKGLSYLSFVIYFCIYSVDTEACLGLRPINIRQVMLCCYFKLLSIYWR